MPWEATVRPRSGSRGRWTPSPTTGCRFIWSVRSSGCVGSSGDFGSVPSGLELVDASRCRRDAGSTVDGPSRQTQLLAFGVRRAGSQRARLGHGDRRQHRCGVGCRQVRPRDDPRRGSAGPGRHPAQAGRPHAGARCRRQCRGQTPATGPVRGHGLVLRLGGARRREPEGRVDVGGRRGDQGRAADPTAVPVLKGAGINFIGNVEGRDVFTGEVDVVVCDGFTGQRRAQGGRGSR